MRIWKLDGKSAGMLVLLVIWCVVLVTPRYVGAQEDDAASRVTGCQAVIKNPNTNLRQGPDTLQYAVLDVLPAGYMLPVVGVNAVSDWLAVHYHDAEEQLAPQAWIHTGVVMLEGTCDALPSVPNPGPPAELLRLQTVPVLPAAFSDQLHEVYAHGQALGNDPHAFTKIGDCNTDTAFFLAGFDQDLYDLGPYADLQPTIEYFTGWFEHISLAGQVGYSALTMLDDMWVNPAICPATEGAGPVACEYRLTRPSIAVMMFGPNDTLNLTEDLFEASVRGIIELSLEQGVIPVVTTFTWHEDRLWNKTLRFNVILVKLAEEYQIPLINFWRAAQALPNYGLVADYTHLTTSRFGGNNYTIAFTGEETFSGYALRNLLTLQMFDMLRREVLAAP